MRANHTGPVAVALDVGGSSVKSGLVTSGGRIISRVVRTPVASDGDAGTILDTFAAAIQDQLGELARMGGRLAGVGFGFPSAFDYENGICLIHDVLKYESLYGMRIGDEIGARVDLRGRPVRFRNDAEAAIVGEAIYGVGRDYRRLIGITLGTGFGSAFVVDCVRLKEGPGIPQANDGMLFGEMYRGERVDDVFSIRGLLAQLAAAGIPVESVREAADRARRDDRAAQAVFSRFGDDLGRFLKPYVRAFEPEAVLVLGGIAGAFELFGDALADALSVPVRPTALGSHAGLLGAAELVLPG